MCSLGIPTIVDLFAGFLDQKELLILIREMHTFSFRELANVAEEAEM